MQSDMAASFYLYGKVLQISCEIKNAPQGYTLCFFILQIFSKTHYMGTMTSKDAAGKVASFLFHLFVLKPNTQGGSDYEKETC